MSSNVRRILLSVFAVLVAGALIWALVPARLLSGEPPSSAESFGETPQEALTPTPEAETESEIPVAADSGSDAKLPAPNFAVLSELQEEAEGGNTESLKELCKYVTGADLYDLGEFQISEELAASCAELR